MKFKNRVKKIVLLFTILVTSLFLVTSCGNDDVDTLAIDKFLDQIADNLDTIKLEEDVIAGDIDIDIPNGATIDLNGKTLDIKSFAMESDKTGEYTIKNGTIKSVDDILVLMKKATINLLDINFIVEAASEIIMQTSPNTLNIAGDTSFTTTSDKTASLVIEEGTRVVVEENVTKPINIEIIGKDVDVENNSNSLESITIAQNVGGEISIINNGSLDTVENNSSSCKVVVQTKNTSDITVTGTNIEGVSTQLVKYSVTAHSSDHILSNDISYNEAIDLEYFANLTYKEGYEFEGWYTEDGTNGNWGSEVTKDTLVLKDMDIYAKFDALTFTVTFVIENTRLEYEVQYNNKVTLPQDSLYSLTEGYYITKWINSDITTNVCEIKFPYVVTQDMEIRAEVSNLYTLTIHKNDGSEEVITKNLEYNTEFISIDDLNNLTSFNPPVGMVLEGYYTTKECETLITYPFNIKDNTEVYANYVESQEPIITFYTDYGQNHDGMFLYPHVEDGKVYLQDSIVGSGGRSYKYGYVLKSWSTDMEGMNVVAGFDGKNNWAGGIYLPSNGESNLYAQFEKLPMITYNAADGMFKDGSKTFVGQEDIEFGEYPEAPILEGKSFAGWFSEKDGKGVEYMPTRITITKTKDYNILEASIFIPTETVYYAYYTDELVYTMHANPYNEDLGLTFSDGSTTKEVILYKHYNKYFVVDEYNPLIENFFTTSKEYLPMLAQFNVSGKIANKWVNSEGVVLNCLDLIYNENIQTNCNWYPNFINAHNKYTYDANGGEFIWADEKIEKLYSYWHDTSRYTSRHNPIITLDFVNLSDGYPDYIYANTPQRDGYEFYGWYTLDGTNEDYGTYVYTYKYYDSGSTFYAKWEKIEDDEIIPGSGFSIAFDANDGKIACGPPYEPQDIIDFYVQEIDGEIYFDYYIEEFFNLYYIQHKLQKSGMYFLSWQTLDGTNGDFGSEVIFDIDTMKLITVDTGEVINKDTILYAKWGTKAEFVAKYPEFEEMMMY